MTDRMKAQPFGLTKAVSRGENSVSNFMNGALFASDVLNTNRESDK